MDGKHRTANHLRADSNWDLEVSPERIRGADAHTLLLRKPKPAFAASEANRVTFSLRSPLCHTPTLTKRSAPGEHAAVREGSTAAFRSCGSRTADQASPNVEFYDLPPDFRK